VTTDDLEAVSHLEKAPDGSSFSLCDALDLVPDAVIGIDRNWLVSYANVAARKLITEGDLLFGRNYWNHFVDSGGTASPSWGYFHSAMKDGIPAEFVQFFPQIPNGWMRVTVRPVSGGIAAFFHDVSLEKQAMAALEHSEKLASLGRLISSIAHEICNPLEAITNLLYLLRHDADGVNHETCMSLAEQELRRASAIASQTLGFARQRPTPALVSCDELVRNVLSLLKSRIVSANVHIDTDALAPAPVLCYEGEVKQILNNLIANAIEAMPAEGGRLVLRTRLSTRKPGRGAVVTVADTGLGMSNQTLSRSFNPFFTTKGEKGNGLGLWISREIAARHGGTLKARSSQHHSRRGSVFQLFLPVESTALAS
jgi:signal transduction histidine kinase